MPSLQDLQRINDLMVRSQEAESIGRATVRFRETIDQWRETIAVIANGVKNLKTHAGLRGANEENKAETIANIMLSYRHLEDARTRLGKAIQAFEASDRED